jgi:ABC-type multidrug transport system fused ATPase/permease subunit
MQVFKKLLSLLTIQERKSAGLLLSMMLIMAFLDMIGVASIMPFVAVLTNPQLVETNIILKTMFEVSAIFGVKTNHQFLLALGTLVFVLLIVSLAFKALTAYTQVNFVQMREYSIAKRLVESYMHQPYSWFLNRNSADLGKTILSEVSIVISAGISPMLTLIAQSSVGIALLILLILADPKLAMTVGFTISLAYGCIYKLSLNFLNHIGKERLKANALRFNIVSEAFGAIKEIKVGGLEESYIKRFSYPAQNIAKYMAASNVIRQLPRFALEALAFGGLLILILYFISKGGTFINALPVIALYVFAGYRIMPAIQQIYSSFASLRFVGPALDSLYEDHKTLQQFYISKDKSIMQFKNILSLDHINYHYPNAQRKALDDINLIIPAKNIVGVVGATGSGKTTLVDTILGLLETQNGTLIVDGKVINKDNIRSWQRSIGYVPQYIYLADDTICANIAFGVPREEVDYKAVEQAAKLANLHEFVKSELNLKYETVIGERGIRLSGGQRQRIGIARALYHKPQLLILDEATSALDNLTERKVMEAVHKLRKDITIILIAHRLSTVKKCDIIFLLEKGKLTGQGTFKELIQSNETFRETAKYI